MIPTWYLGPIGDLRPLPCPEVNLEVNPVRYGGVHQGLSGARVFDITGFRNDYKLDFTYLDQSEFMWLEALFMQIVPGPHYLINPLKRNLLSAQASALYPGLLGMRVGGETALSNDCPAELPYPVRSMRVVDWTGPVSLMIFDNSRPVPIYSADPLVSSVYLKAEDEITVTLKAYWYDRFGSIISSTDTTLGVDTEWSRYWMSYLEVPAGAAGMTPAIDFGTAGADVFVCAPQVECGVSAPTPFELGGGSASVIIDQLPETSPRFPLRDVSVSLLET